MTKNTQEELKEHPITALERIVIWFADNVTRNEELRGQLRMKLNYLLSLHEKSLREKLAEEVGKIFTILSKDQIDLYGGKLPYVFFGGSTEQQAVTIYRKALEDFRRYIAKLITNK